MINTINISPESLENLLSPASLAICGNETDITSNPFGEVFSTELNAYQGQKDAVSDTSLPPAVIEELPAEISLLNEENVAFLDDSISLQESLVSLNIDEDIDEQLSDYSTIVSENEAALAWLAVAIQNPIAYSIPLQKLEQDEIAEEAIFFDMESKLDTLSEDNTQSQELQFSQDEPIGNANFTMNLTEEDNSTDLTFPAEFIAENKNKTEMPAFISEENKEENFSLQDEQNFIKSMIVADKNTNIKNSEIESAPQKTADVKTAMSENKVTLNTPFMQEFVTDTVKEISNPQVSETIIPNQVSITTPSFPSTQTQNIHSLVSADLPENIMPSKIDGFITAPEWGDKMAERITWMLSNQQKTANLQLDPPELGPLAIKISMHANGANVIFGSEHLAVREAIEQALPRLKDSMHEMGVQLTNVEIANGFSQSGFFKDQQQPYSDLAFAKNTDGSFIEGEKVLQKITERAQGLVDLFV